MARASKKLTAGAAVQTNDAFRRKFPRMTQWQGVLLREHSVIAGAWYVQMTAPAGLRMQVINQKFLEVSNG